MKRSWNHTRRRWGSCLEEHELELELGDSANAESSGSWILSMHKRQAIQEILRAPSERRLSAEGENTEVMELLLKNFRVFLRWRQDSP